MKNKLTTFSIITMLLLSILSCNESSNKEEEENERSKSNLKENISILKIYETSTKRKLITRWMRLQIICNLLHLRLQTIH